MFFVYSGMTWRVSHTIGFKESLNHPEIVMYGLSTDLIHKLLNDIGELIKKGHSFAVGDICSEVPNGYAVKFVALNESNINKYFRAANAYYGKCDFETLKCVWPDKDGTFQKKIVARRF